LFDVAVTGAIRNTGPSSAAIAAWKATAAGESPVTRDADDAGRREWLPS
jgi:hypothetical protein